MDRKSVFGRDRQTPLVGRNSELESLRQLFVAAKAEPKSPLGRSRQATAIPLDTLRRPQCMVLMGETGIGKTRLAEEVSLEAEERGWVAIWSRSYAQESTIPYRLWIEVLRSVIDAGIWQEQDLHEHPLVYARLATMLPELYSRLPAGLPRARQSPEQEQQSLWEAVLELFKAVSERSPLLIVLDDLQWADTSSCELLAYLARRSPGVPLAFLATCRETELTAKHPLRPLLAHMQREHNVKTLPLRPLTDTQISSMFAYLPEGTVQYIQTQSGGNPFFAEELARSISTTSLHENGKNRQKVQRKRSTLPETIAAALHNRLGKLSRACQQLLSNAAVLGGSFEFSLICSMETGTSGTVDEDTVLDLLDEALHAGVLIEEGKGARVNYRFWHPLLVSHLYDGLSATKRALLHRRAAELLRQTYAKREAEGAATIAYHLIEGGSEPEQIVYYATLAGDHAYALSAYPEAERHYRAAVENARVIQVNGTIAPDEHVRLAALLEQLGECVRIQGNAEEARQIYEQALAERTVTPSTRAGASATTHPDEEREAQVDALLWSEVGWTWYATSDYARARQYCEQGEQVLREAGIVDGPAWARLHFLQSYILWQEGSYDEARRIGYLALELFAEHLLKHPALVGDTAPLTRLRRTLEGDPVDVARTHRLLGSLAYSIGQPTEALTHLNKALVLLEQHDHQRELAHVCCNVGHIHIQKAEHELAQEYLRRSLNLAERIGDTPLTAVVFSNLGDLAARTGNLAEAESWYRRSLELAEQIDDHVYRSTWNAALAAVLQDQGRLSEAATCIRHALLISRAMGNTPCIGLALVAMGNMRILQAREARQKQDNARFQHFLLRAQGALQRGLALKGVEAETQAQGQLALAQVFLLRGDLAQAQQQATQTLEEAQHYESTRLLARTQHLLGTILSAQGQSAQAEQHLTQALHIAQQHGMRLECARILQSYGIFLLQNDTVTATRHEQGLRSLQEARHLFTQCQATLDLQYVEHIIATYGDGI
nr:tetratricopeptide repeat protein [Ktedonobacteraceae bacterium]